MLLPDGNTNAHELQLFRPSSTYLLTYSEQVICFVADRTLIPNKLARPPNFLLLTNSRLMSSLLSSVLLLFYVHDARNCADPAGK